MKRRFARTAPALLACLTVAGVVLVPSSASADHERPLDGFKHIVVIYEENHSFDNLYGNWGDINGQQVMGLSDATAADDPGGEEPITVRGLLGARNRVARRGWVFQ